MGHIKLVVPVVHIWYFKSLPNKIGYLLGMSSKKLESIVYYERYVVIQPGIRVDKGQNYGDLLRAVPGVNVIQTSARDINVTSRQNTTTLSNSQLVLLLSNHIGDMAILRHDWCVGA